MKEDILNIIRATNLSTCVYVITNNQNGYQINKLELHEDAVLDIQQNIIDAVDIKYFSNEVEYLDISQIATEKKNVIYTLSDYKEIEGLDFVSFNDNINNPYQITYGDFVAFMIKISDGENSIYCYQNIFPASLIKRNGKVPLIRSGNTFSQTKNNIFVVEKRVDFIIYEQELYVQNWKMLQSKYSFNDYIIKSADKTIERVKETGLLEDMAKLIEENKKITISKQLMKATNSPIFNVPKEAIIKNAQTCPTYKKLFNNEGCIVVNTIEKVKIFIKLLNDDILISPLTNQEYSVTSKKETEFLEEE